MIRNELHAGGLSLAEFRLHADEDVVLLARRARQAGEELGLDRRELRAFSAATYEAARQLAHERAVSAELRLADGPSLQIVFRVRCERREDLSRLRARVRRWTEPLRPLVHDVQLTAKDGVLSLCLGTVLRRAPVPIQGADQPAPADSTEVEREVPSDELRERYEQLARAFHALQCELQDTNSGVIALYAELESQADQLRAAEDRFRLLLDSVHDYAICMLTPQGEIASWNAGAERLFGYGADEVIGRSFALFYPAPARDRGVPSEHLREAQERGRLAGECTRVRSGGVPFDAHVVLTPVLGRRGLAGFALVVRDITQRKRLEDDLRRRAEELAAANRAKEDFLATLSHELRTPLNAMLGWTRLLRVRKLDGAARERALETIERNAHIQEQLIADILDVSRIVTGKLRLELRPTGLAPIVCAALDALRPAADAKGIQLVGRTDVDGTVLGDPDRLQQVVWNLLANAIKFTPAGGLVTIAIERSGSAAMITVADSGEGIAGDFLPFVFDRFKQGDASVTRPHGGLGLGLSIVRHIVELHGGQVHAHSDGLGRGAMFSVQLPVRPIESPLDELRRSEEPPITKPGMPRK